MKQSVLIIFLLGIGGFCEKAWGRPAENEGEEDDLMFNDGDDDVDDESEAPRILSRGENITTEPGHSIRLPCDIENVENAVVQWRRNFSTPIFFDGSKQLEEPRYTLTKSFTLDIHNVSSLDEYPFTCQLVGEDDQTITYFITVKEKEITESGERRDQGMPRVIRILPEKSKTLKKGELQTISCEVNGDPTPMISWTHKGNPLKQFNGKNRITIEGVTRNDTGKYVCTATNPNGQDSRSTELQVVYPPEIKMTDEAIIVGVGYESEIICTVYSHPQAQVTWQKGDEELVPTHRITMETDGHDHYLRISGTTKSDYGFYTCIAINNLGESKKSVELSGKPGKPVFENSSYSEDSISSPLLTWNVKSFKPIEEFEVLYKKQHVDDWVTAPLGEGTKHETFGIIYKYSQIFKDLEAGAYNAKVRAKNTYGWSDYSDVYTFAGNDIGRAMQSKLLEAASTDENNGVSSLEISRISLVFLLSLLIAHRLQ
uniref:Ig-like domain-containing protein n=1 Tax=Pristhesancus plagipennis TaxID=1955184 RepID=A0A2K8JXA7_PRIPG|nr:secreted hypothetical protein [Pristhesancus plagipennis]